MSGSRRQRSCLRRDRGAGDIRLDRIYVAFRAKDPNPGDIRAHYADRDAPALDDTVGFFIDTFNDQRRGYQFRINARGVQMDAVNSDVDGIEDWSWIRRSRSRAPICR